MNGFSVVLLILGPMALGSVVVASLPVRSARARVILFSIHIGVSVLLLALLDGPFALWLIVLGPGLAIAIARLIVAARRLRAANPPVK